MSGSPSLVLGAASVAPTRRIAALDAIRGLAILLVLVGHYAHTSILAYLGVYLFFVLSGYLITGLLQRELSATGTLRLRRFYVRRFLRLSPPYLLWVAVTVAALWPRMGARDWSELLAMLTYTTNYHQLLWPGSPPQPGSPWPFAAAVHHSWSLAVEEQFYLLWPLMLLGLRRSHRVVSVIGAAAGGLLLWRFATVMLIPGLYAERAFDTSAGWLCLGCWLALRHTLVPSLPRMPPLEWLGTVSYSAYLWHMWGWAIGTALLPGLPGLGLSILLTLLAAGLSATWVEQPILAWRDRRYQG